MSKDCSICGSKIPPHTTSKGVVYWEGGHNAMPVAEGRCCDLCHDNIVLPERIQQTRKDLV
tara:strand:- start:141 stop:323 length:183 start_codon:yes stop_codon:yes gene_type:complete